ncbi:MAG: hypothetical protein Q9174_001169 [Haloplaca sp. 1 TL-2023]
MARRRHKKRTHVGAFNGPTNGTSANSSARGPKTMVIRVGAGEVGSSVTQLVKDVRSTMEPSTASRLRVSVPVLTSLYSVAHLHQERRSNKLRDYTTMAGPLGVSHLLLFSRSSTGNTNLRLALTPRGPTLHFRVETYSLCKDVRKALRHPQGGGKEYLTPPLLVMNNFLTPETEGANKPSVPKHLESLSTTIFQSLFPPISPQSTSLSSIRRVLLLNRELHDSLSTSSDNTKPYVLSLRHYAITTKPSGLSKGVRRINKAERTLKERASKKGLPNLGNLEDVADYILDPSAAGGGFTSGSESEVETDAEVEVMDMDQKKIVGRKQSESARPVERNGQRVGARTQKRAVRLVELGPRMTLRMTKAEDGVCGGKVMWHEYVSKTEDEIRGLEKTWDSRKREKAERKRVQKENVERKREARAPGDPAADGEQRALDDEADSEGIDDWESDILEDETAAGQGA